MIKVCYSSSSSSSSRDSVGSIFGRERFKKLPERSRHDIIFFFFALCTPCIFIFIIYIIFCVNLFLSRLIIKILFLFARKATVWHGTTLEAKLGTTTACHVITSIHTLNQQSTLCASYPSFAGCHAVESRFVSVGAVAVMMSTGTTSNADLFTASPALASVTCILRVDDCDAIDEEILHLLLLGLLLLGLLLLGLLLLGLLRSSGDRSNLLHGTSGVGAETVMRVAGDASMSQFPLKLQKFISQFFRRREQPLHRCIFHSSPTSTEASDSLPRHWCPFRHLNSAVLL